MAARKQQPPDEQQRHPRNESGDALDPAQQPTTHKEGESEVGDEGEQQGSEQLRGDQNESDADRALQDERRSIKRRFERRG